GFPVEVTGTSVNRQCGSSQQAFHFAAQAVQSGQADVVLAAGVESMSRVPMGSDALLGASPWFPPSNDYPFKFVSQRESAEMIAEKWGISRRQCEELAYRSHMRAAAATAEGKLAAEIVAVGGVSADEGIRADTSLEKLAGLKPVVKPDGVVTAGTSS